tara:strand:+ start:103 stop:588 length:486 start_codon:yes stop_codon:yes gene_type:complete
VDEESQGAKLFNALRKANFPSLQPQRPWTNVTSKPKGNNWGHSSKKLILKKESHYRPTPISEIQSIMEAGPFEDPLRSIEEREENREDLILAVHETFMGLTEDEQWLYHMLVDVGLSLRFVAIILDIPKTTMARRRDDLANKLRTSLLQQKAVQEYLTRET